LDIAAHSKCQPGYDNPHGLSHFIIWFSGAFIHIAKSYGFLFSGSTSTLAPAIWSSIFLFDNTGYLSNFDTSKYIAVLVSYPYPFSTIFLANSNISGMCSVAFAIISGLSIFNLSISLKNAFV